MSITIKEETAPSTPSANYGTIYNDSSDSLLKYKNDAGTVYILQSAILSYDTNGLITQTATNTFTGRTVTGTSNRIDVTNGNGVAGNPTLDISATYVGQTSITTLGTITTGTWTGTAIAIGNGGTGQTSAVNAFNALAPTTTKGDLIAYSTTNARVAVGTNGFCLVADSGATPGIAWKASSQGKTVVALSDGATPALDASLGDVFTLSAAGDRTIAVPSNPVNGQKITIIHFASGGARTLALNSGAGGFAFGSDLTGLTATASGKYDFIGCIYSSLNSKWSVVAVVKGY